MPRHNRFLPAGCVAHVTNRGNDKKQLFFYRQNYQHFMDLLAEARRRYPVEIYAYNVMPNHFHAVMTPKTDVAVSACLQWLLGSHGCDLRVDTRTVGHGHVYQHRFWSEVIEGDRHLFNVLRYVEANALRAQLVARAEQWEWGSLWERTTGQRKLLDPLPSPLPQDWVTIVNVPQPLEELQKFRAMRRPGRPGLLIDLRKPKNGVRPLPR